MVTLPGLPAQVCLQVQLAARPMEICTVNAIPDLPPSFCYPSRDLLDGSKRKKNNITPKTPRRNRHGINDTFPAKVTLIHPVCRSSTTTTTSPADRIPLRQHAVHHESQVPSIISVPRQHDASPAAQPLLARQLSRLFLVQLGEVRQDAPRLHPLIGVVKVARKGDVNIHTSNPVGQADARQELLHHGPRQSHLLDLDASMSRIWTPSACCW